MKMQIKVPIFVHSHRRSGTHYLIDLIRNHFDVCPEVCDGSDDYFDQLCEHPIVIKDHQPFPGFAFSQPQIWRSRDHLAFAVAVNTFGKHLYICRDPRKVLRSLYFFDRAGVETAFAIPESTSFRDYVFGPSLHEAAKGKSRLRYWSDHVATWTAESNVHVIRFEACLQDEKSALDSLEKYLGLPRMLPRDLPPTGVGRGIPETSHGTEATWTDEIEHALADVISVGSRAP